MLSSIRESRADVGESSSSVDGDSDEALVDGSGHIEMGGLVEMGVGEINLRWMWFFTAAFFGPHPKQGDGQLRSYAFS